MRKILISIFISVLISSIGLAKEDICPNAYEEALKLYSKKGNEGANMNYSKFKYTMSDALGEANDMCKLKIDTFKINHGMVPEPIKKATLIEYPYPKIIPVPAYPAVKPFKLRQWVRGYYHADGSYVSGYWRTNPALGRIGK